MKTSIVSAVSRLLVLDSFSPFGAIHSAGRLVFVSATGDKTESISVVIIP